MAVIRVHAGLWFTDSNVGLGNLDLAGTRNGSAYDGSYAVNFGGHQLSGPLVMVAEQTDELHCVGVIPIDPPLFVDLIVNDETGELISGAFKYGVRKGTVDTGKLVPKQDKYQVLAIPGEKHPQQKTPPGGGENLRLLVCSIM